MPRCDCNYFMSSTSYIKFLWNSSNAHGVHSPFVFDIVSRGLAYKTRHLPNISKEEKAIMSRKSLDVFCRISTHFRAEKLLVLGEESGTVTEILRTCGTHLNQKLWFFSTLAPIPGAIDLAYISGTDNETLLQLINQVQPNMGNRSVCVVGNIHTSPEAETAWETLKKDPRITVTIDTYHLGMVFIRPGQAKEHFIIRTTTSKLLDFALGAKTLWGLLY